MTPKTLLNIFLVGLFVLSVLGAVSAFAANLNVSDSDVAYLSRGVTANELKPAVCAQNLTNIVRGAGSITGTADSDLILASPGDDVIDGGGGDDCILAGAGNDTLDGGAGSDVCLGGGGTNTLTNCESAP